MYHFLAWIFILGVDSRVGKILTEPQEKGKILIAGGRCRLQLSADPGKSSKGAQGLLDAKAGCLKVVGALGLHPSSILKNTFQSLTLRPYTLPMPHPCHLIIPCHTIAFP